MSTMAEASTAGKKKKRVERRGRFTITEIEPDSPAAGLEEPSMFSADGDVYDDNDSGGEEDTNRQSFVRDTAAAAALMATERISPFGSAVFERSNGAVRVVDTDGVSVDGNSTHGGSIVTETAVASTYDDGQPRGQSQSDLRVQRKGRFTIIELSSDTPPSSQAPAEEFSTTTSISITSTQVSQANAQNLSSSPTAVSAVMAAPPTPLSRAVSESVVQTTRRPSRSFVHSSDGLELSHSHDTPRARSGSPTHPIQDTTSLPSLSSSFGNAPFRTQPHEPPSTSPQLKPMKSPAGNGVALTAALNGSALAVANSGEKRQPTQELGANRRHLASRQKAITISAEQFIQQQQTIASLIRQQQELKQLISVLQEQQQHLMSVPMHLPEFTLDQAHTEAQKDSMREVQIQVTTLSRANDALQNLLSQAEQDAHERTMEIECLSDENDELRHRQLILERKYYEERKRSLTLEQELQRTKRSLHAARQKGSEQHQQQQFLRKYQHKLLSQPQDLDDPILDHRLASTHAAA